MPVTARLSKAFYERFGEKIANELVDWFNQVDATYRNDLRELNELNFSRFDAKLEQRLAELNAKWDTRFAALEGKLEQRVAELRTELAHLEKRLETKIGQMGAGLIKWSFVFWATAIAAIVGFR